MAPYHGAKVKTRQNPPNCNPPLDIAVTFEQIMQFKNSF